MKKNLLVCLALFAITYPNQLAAQGKKRCGTTEYMARLKAEDPALDARMKESELHIQELCKQNPTMRIAAANAVITIPVVFHVLYRFPSQNISQSRLEDQITTLNNDFARLNADSTNTPVAFRSRAANTNIQFCLAQRDPSGNPTTGILKIPTTVNGFDPKSNQNAKYTALGGHDAWPTTQYLNVWVCDFTGASNDVLGVSQFPNGNIATDGICVLYTTVGGVNFHGNEPDYNLGRTLTHEVGHWFGLYHIWGDDSDGNGTCVSSTECFYSDAVGDTPNQGEENYGCPTSPLIDCCASSTMVGNTGDPVNGAMFMNYMDYVNDNCMNLFTQGQSTRMNTQIASYRSAITTSNGCVVPVGMPEAKSMILDVSVFPNPASGSITLSGEFAGLTDAVITISNVVGEVVYTMQLKNVWYVKQPIDLSGRAEGMYTLSLRTTGDLINKKIILTR